MRNDHIIFSFHLTLCKTHFNLLDILSKNFDLYIITEADLQMMGKCTSSEERLKNTEIRFRTQRKYQNESQYSNLTWTSPDDQRKTKKSYKSLINDQWESNMFYFERILPSTLYLYIWPHKIQDAYRFNFFGLCMRYRL